MALVRESPIKLHNLDTTTTIPVPEIYRRHIRTSLTYSFIPRLATVFYFWKSGSDNFGEFVKKRRQLQTLLSPCQTMEDVHKALGINMKEDDKAVPRDNSVPPLINLLRYYREQKSDLWQNNPDVVEWTYHIALLAKDVHRVRAAAFDVEDMLTRVLLDRDDRNAFIPYTVTDNELDHGDKPSLAYDDDIERTVANIHPCYLERIKWGTIAVPRKVVLLQIVTYMLSRRPQRLLQSLLNSAIPLIATSGCNAARASAEASNNGTGPAMDADATKQRDSEDAVSANRFWAYLHERVVHYSLGIIVAAPNATALADIAANTAVAAAQAAVNALNIDYWQLARTYIRTNLTPDEQAMLVAICDAVGGEGSLGDTPHNTSAYMQDIIRASNHSANPYIISRNVMEAYGVHPQAVQIFLRTLSTYLETDDMKAFIETFYAASYAQLLGLTYGGEAPVVPNGERFEGSDENEEQTFGPPPFGIYDIMLEAPPTTYPCWFVPTRNALKNPALLSLKVRPSRIDCGVNALATELANRLDRIVSISRSVSTSVLGAPAREGVTEFMYSCVLAPLQKEISECEKLAELLQKEWAQYGQYSREVYSYFKSVAARSTTAADTLEFHEARLQTILKAQEDRSRDVIVRTGKDSAPIRLDRSLADLTKEENGQMKKLVNRLIRAVSLKTSLTFHAGRSPNSFHLLPPWESVSFLRRPHSYQSPYIYASDKGSLCVDVVTSGSRVLGLMKEDILNEIMEGIADPPKRKVADKIASQYLRHLVREQIFRVVLDRYAYKEIKKKMPMPALEDLAFFPKLKVDFTELQVMYAPAYSLDNSHKLAYKIPWDYFSTTQDWEYRLPHYVMENSSIVSLINRLRHFVPEKDDHNYTVMHHLIETGNYYVLQLFRSRHVEALEGSGLTSFALSRFYLHQSVASIPSTNFSMELVVWNMIDPLFRETCMMVSTEEFGFAILRQLQAYYVEFGLQVIRIFEDALVSSFSRDEFFTTTDNDRGVDDVLDTYYNIESPRCILRSSSHFYLHVRKLIARFLRKKWLPTFMMTANLRLKVHGDLKGIEKELVRVVLGPPNATESIDTVMEDVRSKLINTTDNPEVEDNLLRYSKVLVMRIMYDLRSIATNIARLYINVATLKKVMAVLRQG